MRVAKGIPRIEWPLGAILKEAQLHVKSDTGIDTTAASFTLFRVPANTFIEGFRVKVTTAFTSGAVAQPPTLWLGDTPGGRQFGVFGASLQDTGVISVLSGVGAEYDTPVTIYGTMKSAAATDGAADIWLIYRPNSNESPWAA